MDSWEQGWHRVKWLGEEAVLEEIKRLAKRAGPNGMRRGVRQASSMIVKALKSALGRHATGLLELSLGHKVSLKLDKVYAVVGSRRSYRLMESQTRAIARMDYFDKAATQFIKKRVSEERKRKRDKTQRYRVPSRYAHLVEKGHKRGGGKTTAQAYPFMRPTFAATHREAKQIIIRELLKEIKTKGPRI